MSVIPSIKVTFYLMGDEFSIDDVTREMGVFPTETRTKDSFPPNGLACTIWSISHKEENCIAISILFEKLLTLLYGKNEIIKRLCEDDGIEASFEVVIHMKDGDSPEVVLPREVVTFASSINAEIGFDLYCYE